MSNEERDASLALINAGLNVVPQSVALGVSIVDVSMEPPFLVGRLPWNERLVGNPELGTLHGGVVTTFLDGISGAAVYLKLRSAQAIVTLDLRLDYLKPATARRELFARAECIKLTKHVAFVRATAYHDTFEDPVALASATFMLTNRGTAVFGQ